MKQKCYWLNEDMRLHKKFCPNCGSEMVLKIVKDDFCMKCGEKTYKVYSVCPKKNWFNVMFGKWHYETKEFDCHESQLDEVKSLPKI